MSESNGSTRPYNSRSKMITEGDVRAPNRAMLRAVGLTDEDFNKPLVGIASTWSEITPCNSHINRLAEKVKEGVRVAGGVPQIFGTITVSDGISMGTEGMKFSLPSREVIANSHRTSRQCPALRWYCRHRWLRQKYAWLSDGSSSAEHP